MQLFIIHRGSKHTFLQAFYMFITFINIKYDCRSKIDKVTYLMKNSFTTSYVAAMFHPTIGQLAHQSLSNAATPELGMIPPE